MSQDSDLTPAVESAIPLVPGLHLFGITGTTWIPIDKTTYDKCIDPTDYR